MVEVGLFNAVTTDESTLQREFDRLCIRGSRNEVNIDPGISEPQPTSETGK
jgi:hypothetical protein